MRVKVVVVDNTNTLNNVHSALSALRCIQPVKHVSSPADQCKNGVTESCRTKLTRIQRRCRTRTDILIHDCLRCADIAANWAQPAQCYANCSSSSHSSAAPAAASTEVVARHDRILIDALHADVTTGDITLHTADADTTKTTKPVSICVIRRRRLRCLLKNG